MQRIVLIVLPALLLTACGEQQTATPATPPAATVAAESLAGEYQVGDYLPRADMDTADAADSRYREVEWDDLIPRDWNPMALLDALNLDEMEDNDPRAAQVMEQIRVEWDKAPVETSLNGASIKIPGFFIPLDKSGELVHEFLLVPYFGACVHVPPPPANQIIHVVPEQPIKAELMDAVWVSGELEASQLDTEWGVSGYRLKAQRVVEFE